MFSENCRIQLFIFINLVFLKIIKNQVVNDIQRNKMAFLKFTKFIK